MSPYRRPLRHRPWFRLLRAWWAQRGAWGPLVPAAATAAAMAACRWWLIPAVPVVGWGTVVLLAAVPAAVWRLSPPPAWRRRLLSAALLAGLAWTAMGWWPVALVAVVLVVASRAQPLSEAETVRTDGELHPWPTWMRPRAVTHRARQRGRSVAARTLRSWITSLEQGITRADGGSDGRIMRLPTATPRASTRPVTRDGGSGPGDHAPQRADRTDAAALDDHAPHTISVPVALPGRPPRDPVAHVRWLLERAGDDGCTPLELYTAVNRSRSWWSPIARDAAWMERGADGRYRLAQHGDTSQ